MVEPRGRYRYNGGKLIHADYILLSGLAGGPWENPGSSNVETEVSRLAQESM
jgi:hypothetical protein